MGVEPFEQLFQEMAVHYDPNNWRTLVEVEELETTERKTKKKLKRGGQKV
jgi:hypothetical protein